MSGVRHGSPKVPSCGPTARAPTGEVGGGRMSQHDYDRSGTSAGWPVLLACLFFFWLIVLAPVLMLGAAGALLWRHYRWRRRWTATLAILALVPLTAAAQLKEATPVGLFLGYIDMQWMVGWSLVRRLVGLGRLPEGLTAWSYVAAVGPVTPLLSVLAGVGIALVLGPRQPKLQRREAAGVAVPRRVERLADEGVEHPHDGWALGYRADGRPLVLDDDLCRHHVLVCGATGSGKTTVLRHLLDGVARRGPVVIL